MSQVAVEGGSVSGFGIRCSGKTDPFRGPWKHLAVQTLLTVAFSGGQEYICVIGADANSIMEIPDKCLSRFRTRCVAFLVVTGCLLKTKRHNR